MNQLTAKMFWYRETRVFLFAAIIFALTVEAPHGACLRDGALGEELNLNKAQKMLHITQETFC
jgi:hypothetical protein